MPVVMEGFQAYIRPIRQDQHLTPIKQAANAYFYLICIRVLLVERKCLSARPSPRLILICGLMGEITIGSFRVTIC